MIQVCTVQTRNFLQVMCSWKYTCCWWVFPSNCMNHHTFICQCTKYWLHACSLFWFEFEISNFVYVSHAKICCWNVMLFYVVLSMLIMFKYVAGMLCCSMLFCLCESCSILLLECYVVLCCFVYVNHAQICCWNVMLFYVVLSMWIMLKSVAGMLY